jgi:tetratricopeptide (TPR) repeat protein
MPITPETSRLLGKIAFLGLWEGRFAESESIFSALRGASPERIGPALGLGILHAHKGEYEKAIEILEQQALALDPADEHARVWLGLALLRAGQKQRAEEFLRPLGEKGLIPDVRELANGLLKEGNAPD